MFGTLCTVRPSWIFIKAGNLVKMGLLKSGPNIAATAVPHREVFVLCGRVFGRRPYLRLGQLIVLNMLCLCIAELPYNYIIKCNICILIGIVHFKGVYNYMLQSLLSLACMLKSIFQCISKGKFFNFDFVFQAPEVQLSFIFLNIRLSHPV